MNVKKYLWIVPFFSFITGYIATKWVFRVKTIPAPHLVGKPLHEILPVISDMQLNIRLINQKEEADIPEGIILNQIPMPGTEIKPHQSIFVVTTKKPLSILAPQCIGLPITEALTLASKNDITPCVYAIAHPYPEQRCFAQFPCAGEPLEKNRLILYISSGNNKPIVWPNFIGISAAKTIDFLHNYDINPYIIDDDDNLHSVIIDQRPVAGTLVILDQKQPLSVQLRIQ